MDSWSLVRGNGEAAVVGNPLMSFMTRADWYSDTVGLFAGIGSALLYGLYFKVIQQ